MNDAADRTIEHAAAEAAAPHAGPASPMRGRLFRKYLVLILSLVGGALLVSGGIGHYFAHEENKAALAALQKEKAIAAAARIEQYVRQIEQQLGYASLPQLDPSDLELRRVEFLKLLRQAPEVTDISQIDPQGREQIYVSRLGMDVIGSGKDRSQEPAFQNARRGKPWYGPVYFRKETEPYMTIALRSSDSGPVTTGDVNLKFIWDVVSRIKVGEKGKAYVVDRNGYLVADPDIGLVLRKTDLSALPHVKAALGSAEPAEPATVSVDLAGAPVLVAVAPIASLGWEVFVEQPMSEVNAKLDAAIVRSVALLLAGLAVSALCALLLARGMARPIRTLEAGAASIGAGNLDARIDVRTGDELESLAQRFNQMSAQLRESYAGLERKVEERTAALQDALEQQTAISEILRVISASPTDVQPVMQAVAERAAHLCNAPSAHVVLIEDGALRPLATYSSSGGPVPGKDLRVALSRTTVTGRSALDGETQHIADILPLLDTEFPGARANVEAYGFRAMLAVPLMRDREAYGSLFVWRPEPGLFTPGQVALLQTFARQAAIAIDNVRLFNETREALEQQTAVSDVLRAISGRTFELQPVLETLIENAARLCRASRGFVYIRHGGGYRLMVNFGADAAASDVAEVDENADTLVGRTALSRAVVEIEDALADPSYGRKDTAQRLGFRTMLGVPMLRQGEPIGVLSLWRDEVRRFTPREVQLVTTFADQAVIAFENVRLFDEIREKSRQLEIANKHKSEFLANMSHELRTPLNAIIGFSEVLLERLFGDLNEKQDDYLKDIHASGRHLLGLINDILDLSKIEAGRMELERSRFDLPAALGNAMTLIRERAQRHGIALGLDVAPDVGEIVADERKLKQIVINLLTNAVKFTPDGGRVDLVARREPGRVVVAVRDTGIGIAPGDQAAVFEEFRQVASDYTRKQEGTGLGLALTRRFVELHGGTIRLESTPGEGSTFTFDIPDTPPHPEEGHAWA